MATPTVSAARTARLVGTLGAGRPAYRALADALRLAVADGRIAAGTRLPSERELTGALDVSRTTVTRAYALLRETGYLTSRRGSGSVATLPAGGAQRARRAAVPRGRRRGRHRPHLCGDPGTGRGGRGLRAGGRAAAPIPRRCRLPHPRGARAARGRRRALHRPRPADHPRPGTRDLGCGGRHRHRAPRPRRLRRPGGRRDPRLPQHHRRRPPRRGAPRAAGARPRRVGRRGVGPHGAAVGGHGGPADPRLPQPDRRTDGRRRPGGAGPCPAPGPHRCR